MTTTPKAERKKGGGWRRLFVFLLVLAGSLLVGGFLSFAQHVDTLREPSEIPKADGIVVWTGKGGGRLEAGAQLLRDERGERLLISGVNAQNDLENIRTLLNLSEDMAECCLDLDYDAENTTGNARETASWATALGYNHIILVTSSYHMPRAKLEISEAAGRIRITPYPVVREDLKPWYKDAERTKRLLREYAKLLRVLARGRNSAPEAPPTTPLPVEPTTD